MTHGDLVNLLLLEVSPLGLFWANATGTGRTMDGRGVIKFGLPGSSDILGCYKGRMIGIEAKVGRDQWRQNQRDFADAVHRNHGLYILAHSKDGTGADAIAHTMKELANVR